MADEKRSVVVHKLFNIVTLCTWLHGKLKVFRSLSVGDVSSLFKGITQDYSSIAVDALTGNGCGGKSLKLFFNFRADFFCKIFVSEGKHRLGYNIVLGLGKQVGGNPFRICALVCNDENFGRTCYHIDADSSVHKFLGFCDKFISRTNDNVNSRNGFRSKRKSTDGLGTATRECFCDTTDIGRRHYVFISIRFAVFKSFSRYTLSSFFCLCLV